MAVSFLAGLSGGQAHSSTTLWAPMCKFQEAGLGPLRLTPRPPWYSGPTDQCHALSHPQPVPGPMTGCRVCSTLNPGPGHGRDCTRPIWLAEPPCLEKKTSPETTGKPIMRVGTQVSVTSGLSLRAMPLQCHASNSQNPEKASTLLTTKEPLYHRDASLFKGDFWG